MCQNLHPSPPCDLPNELYLSPHIVSLQLFIDCHAPPELSNFLNCITVDLNSSPLLVQGSLHLLAKGLGFFPSRMLDYMRLYNIRPDIPEKSYLSYFDSEEVDESSEGEVSEVSAEKFCVEKCDSDTLSAVSVEQPVSPVSVTTSVPEGVGGGVGGAGGSGGGGGGGGGGALTRHTHPSSGRREEFNNTSTKFLQIFSQDVKDSAGEFGENEDTKLQAREELDRGFPLSGTDVDKRYVKFPLFFPFGEMTSSLTTNLWKPTQLMLRDNECNQGD